MLGTQVCITWRAHPSLSDLITNDIRHIAGRGPAHSDIDSSFTSIMLDLGDVFANI